MFFLLLPPDETDISSSPLFGKRIEFESVAPVVDKGSKEVLNAEGFQYQSVRCGNG
jgi:hypothetical protein